MLVTSSQYSSSVHSGLEQTGSVDGVLSLVNKDDSEDWSLIIVEVPVAVVVCPSKLEVARFVLVVISILVVVESAKDDNSVGRSVIKEGAPVSVDEPTFKVVVVSMLEGADEV